MNTFIFIYLYRHTCIYKSYMVDWLYISFI